MAAKSLNEYVCLFAIISLQAKVKIHTENKDAKEQCVFK